MKDDTNTDTVDTAGDSSDLQAERDRYYDLLLRKTAEFENYRKRVAREQREMSETASADLIRELLPVVDNLDRALAAEVDEKGADAFRRGVEIIQKQLLELLRKRGVTWMDVVGADFDPNFHEAVEQVVSPGHRDGEIIAEVQRGYMMGDRLLRPAMVRVAKS